MAAHPSWGPAWPNCSRSTVVTLVRRDGLRLPIHRDLAELVSILMDLTEALGYDIVPGWTWGYACRPIAGTKTPSDHSTKTAIDINAPRNPRRADRKFVSDMPRWMINLWKAHGFEWGGDYSWPDPMHFGFKGSVAQARQHVINLRRFLGANGGTTNPPRPAPPGRPGYPGLVRMGSSGNGVRTWQNEFRRVGYDLVADGEFGPATNHVVVDFQRKRRLQADGIAGPTTWHHLVNT